MPAQNAGLAKGCMAPLSGSIFAIRHQFFLQIKVLWKITKKDVMHSVLTQTSHQNANST